MAYNVQLPKIDGLTEKEQIRQIKDYLYQQAEQLGWALNNLEANTTVVYNMPKSLASGGEKVGIDYVVAQGKEDGWSYRKWHSGSFEAYGIFEVTPTAPVLLKTLYQSEEIEITLPFSVGEDAVVYGSASGRYLLGESKRTGESSISVRIMSDDTINTTEGVTVRLHVEGTIKTEDENGSQSN